MNKHKKETVIRRAKKAEHFARIQRLLSEMRRKGFASGYFYPVRHPITNRDDIALIRQRITHNCPHSIDEKSAQSQLTGKSLPLNSRCRSFQPRSLMETDELDTGFHVFSREPLRDRGSGENAR